MRLVSAHEAAPRELEGFTGEGSSGISGEANPSLPDPTRTPAPNQLSYHSTRHRTIPGHSAVRVRHNSHCGDSLTPTHSQVPPAPPR